VSRTTLDIVAAITAMVTRLAANSEKLARDAARDFAAASEAARDDWNAATRLMQVSPRLIRLAACAGRCLLRKKIAGDRADRKNAEDIYRLCADLRGGMLKVGQLLSTRGDLLPPVYIEVLSRLQDRAPALAPEIAIAAIEDELGAPIDELFATFDPEPIAAASLAQVHAATAADGRELAVKLMLPGIEDVVRADLAALAQLARGLGREYLPGIDAGRIADELGRAIDDELDYTREADRLEQFAALAAGDPRWRVPAVIRERSGRRVLTMERIRGTSLSEHLGSCDAAEIERICGLMVELTASQFLRHGVVHGDPHPGNFIVEDGGGLAILDFGCVLELVAAERDAYRQLIVAVLGRDRDAMLSALERAGFSAGSDEAMVELADMFLVGLDPEILATLDPREQLARATEILGAAGGVEVPRSFALIGRIFALLGGLLLSHRPRIDLGGRVMAALAA
jgi:ubiquinone biosynthesis protein